MAEQTANDEHAEIKKRAMRRLIVAGTLVAAAVITLTVLNHQPEERPTPVTTAKAPVVAEPEPLPPEVVPEKPAEEQTAEAPVQETPPIPDSEAAPTSPPPPPPPQVLNKPSQPTPVAAKSRTEIAATSPVAKAPSTDALAPAKSSSPQSVTISPAPAAKKPVERTVAESKSSAPPATVKTTEPIAPKGYVVQLGLFSNYENAVQLQKRLADHGIKSYTETRLHVGPFQNKAEADEAMSRIRKMGINAVVVPAH